MSWDVGEVVVLREVLQGRIRSARPLRVVLDSPDVFAGYLVPRSRVAWPRLVGEEQSQTPDQGWRLVEEEWNGPGSLFVIPAGAAYAAVHFLDRDTGEPVGWKIDFMRPPDRSPLGLDTLDWAFDLLVDADLGRWQAKDEDDLAQLCRMGLLSPADQERLACAHTSVTADLAARRGPFADWAAWRAGPSWHPLDLVRGWDRVDSPGSPGGSVPVGTAADGTATQSVLSRRRARVHAARPDAGVVARSGRGMRLLDAEGRTWLDADLAGGTLLTGHAHPALTEAISRQAALTVGTRLPHEGEVALAEAVAGRFPPAEWALFRPSGGEAWRAASLLARRATGRSTVATWHAADVAVDSSPDDILLLPADGAQAAALLAIAAHRLAAVFFDPVLAAGLAGLPVLAATLKALTGQGVLLVADERRALGTGPGGGCARLGLDAQVIVFGESLFGGLSGGMVGGGPGLFKAGDALGSTGPAMAVGPLQTVAGLETLRLASADALRAVDEQADQLRRRWATAGLGNTVRLPAGATVADLRGEGVLVGGDGTVFLATVASQAEVDELDAAVERSTGTPTGGGRGLGQR